MKMMEVNSLDESKVMLVSQKCDCDKDEAIALLAQANNDPDRAAKLFAILSKYREGSISKPSATPMTLLPEANLVSRSVANHGSDGNSEVEIDTEATKPLMQNSETRGTHCNINMPLFPQDDIYNSSSQLLHDDCDIVRSVVSESDSGEEAHGDYLGPISTESEKTPFNTNPSSTDVNGEEWNFVLPVIPLPISHTGFNPDEDCESFDLRYLVAIMQNGASVDILQAYLRRFNRATIEAQINDDVDGFPAMFYVVETNKQALLRLWVSYGGDVTVVDKKFRIPLLVFAIIHSKNIQTDTTFVTATLLSLGSSPDVIPSAFYSPFLQDLPEAGPSPDVLKDLEDENKAYCQEHIRQKIARTMTLSQRYYLERAAKSKKPSIRQIQVVKRRNAEPLLEIANFLIGQTLAAKLLCNILLSHLLLPSKQPLVLVFAGPSGHGKTELARHLGSLLSLELEVVDCTIFNREIELFGPRQPYIGSEIGSRLNNFLARNNGKRCIVFLDEFEKTNADIHKTLLLPFDNGEYQDRRSGDKINCSRTVWILATNAHDRIIQEFSTQNEHLLFSDDNESEKESIFKQLSRRIKQDFLARHDPPITGRISAFIPFLPFSQGEQAVIVHKYLLELGRSVRVPVNLNEGENEQLLGNVRVRIHEDASVCTSLAQAEYHIDLGARSLRNGVDGIKAMIVRTYLDINEEIVENGDILMVDIEVIGKEVVVNIAPKS